MFFEYCANKQPPAMRLPEKGRMFVDGMASGTGDLDLLRYFLRYGEIADICFLTDQFALVQFFRPSAARHAIAANGTHRINGKRVYVGRAHQKLYNPKPLCERIFLCDKWRYRVGDRVSLRASAGPVFFSGIVNYISVDGKVGWWCKLPRLQSDGTFGNTLNNSSFRDHTQFSSRGANFWQHCQRPGDGGRNWYPEQIVPSSLYYQEWFPRGPNVARWCYSDGGFVGYTWPNAGFTYPTYYASFPMYYTS